MKKLILSLICLAAAWGAAAKVELPEIIGSDMVLQQNAQCRLWGWADPRATVRIETSWGAECTVRSDADGRWSARVDTPAGSYEPQQVTIASGERIVLDNVLIGEVWFAGGQSNMEMPLRGFNNCPIAGANEIIARAGSMRDRLRYVKIPSRRPIRPRIGFRGNGGHVRWRPRPISPPRVISLPNCSPTCCTYPSASSTARGAGRASRVGRTARYWKPIPIST